MRKSERERNRREITKKENKRTKRAKREGLIASLLFLKCNVYLYKSEITSANEPGGRIKRDLYLFISPPYVSFPAALYLIITSTLPICVCPLEERDDGKTQNNAKPDMRQMLFYAFFVFVYVGFSCMISCVCVGEFLYLRV